MTRSHPPVDLSSELDETVLTRVSSQAKERLRQYAKDRALTAAAAHRQLLYLGLGLIRAEPVRVSPRKKARRT